MTRESEAENLFEQGVWVGYVGRTLLGKTGMDSGQWWWVRQLMGQE